MNRVFGIGLPRTGTTSLWRAMQILGWSNCLHYLTPEEWADKGLIIRSGFICDMPIPYHYKKLDNAFPSSKFIYTYRPLHEWADSFERLWDAKTYQVDDSWDHWVNIFWPYITTRSDMVRCFGGHQIYVRDFFKLRPEDILYYPLGSGWEPLCKFLGVPVPDVPYPHLGASHEQQADPGFAIRPFAEGRQGAGPAGQSLPKE